MTRKLGLGLGVIVMISLGTILSTTAILQPKSTFALVREHGEVSYPY